jgi:hypothetical protein
MKIKATISIFNQSEEVEDTLENIFLHAKVYFEKVKYVDIRFHGEREIIFLANTFTNVKKEEKILISASVRGKRNKIYEEFTETFVFSDNFKNWVSENM